MVTTYIVLIAACNCIISLIKVCFFNYCTAGFFSTCALLNSHFDTVDPLMNGLIGGVGGLTMLTGQYLKIVCVGICITLKATQTVIQYHVLNTNACTLYIITVKFVVNVDR